MRYLAILFTFFFQYLNAQNEYITSSNLPIFVITTENNAKIIDEPKITAHLGIINNEDQELNFLTDSYTDYDGLIGIERRGNGTQQFAKVSYGFETRKEDGSNNNVSLLNMPKENDWILYGPFLDKSLIRTNLIYHLGNQMGYYASRTRFCELIVNDDYLGLYILQEKIKVDKNRVDIKKFSDDDTDPSSGGYLFQINVGWSPEIGWESPEFYVDDELRQSHYIVRYPKPEESTNEQKEYIKNLFTDFETAFYNAEAPYIYDAYEPYIDVNTFIDLFIMNEFTKNPDGYRLSTYLHKDADEIDGKIKAGPFWDYNFGFANYVESEKNTEDWVYDNHWWGLYDSVPFWWDKFLEDKFFVTQLQKRWEMWRSQIINEDYLFTTIDQFVSEIDEARKRNYKRWPVLDQPIEFPWYVWDEYSEDIDFMKKWIENRIAWLDQEFLKMAQDFSTTEATVFPNPTNGILNLTFVSDEIEQVKLTINDLTGRVVYKDEFASVSDLNLITLPNLNLSNGVYILSIKSDNIFARLKFIVK